jgi:hypothetical protein
VAQKAFGFVEAEHRLRQDLGLEADTPLTLMHLCARVPPARYQPLMDGYAARRQAAVEADVPEATPPMTWNALRQGNYAIAERVIGALESAPAANGQPG